jgi:hypothetical protein
MMDWKACSSIGLAGRRTEDGRRALDPKSAEVFRSMQIFSDFSLPE